MSERTARRADVLTTPVGPAITRQPATRHDAARPCTGPPRSRAPWMLDARPSCANPIVVLESVSLHRPPLGRLPFSRSRVRAAPCYVLLNPTIALIVCTRSAVTLLSVRARLASFLQTHLSDGGSVRAVDRAVEDGR